ncbi:hypothetical protein DSUL_20107 [Desulfovibrionales bacterium]
MSPPLSHLLNIYVSHHEGPNEVYQLYWTPFESSQHHVKKNLAYISLHRRRIPSTTH